MFRFLPQILMIHKVDSQKCLLFSCHLNQTLSKTGDVVMISMAIMHHGDRQKDIMSLEWSTRRALKALLDRRSTRAAPEHVNRWDRKWKHAALWMYCTSADRWKHGKNPALFSAASTHFCTHLEVSRDCPSFSCVWLHEDFGQWIKLNSQVVWSVTQWESPAEVRTEISSFDLTLKVCTTNQL